MFIHLHNHSAYSLLEGALKIEKLIELAVAGGMPAVALTDTNNLFGALEFAEKARKAGLQPIIGLQLDMARPWGAKGIESRNANMIPRDQLVLLVQNQTGYNNLLDIVTEPYLQREGGDAPPLSLEYLQGRTDGLICLAGGYKGLLGQAMLHKQNEAVGHISAQLETLFPNRLYIELQRHGLPQERQIETRLIELAIAQNLPLVASNDCYFATANEYEAHDALLCIAGGRYVVEEERRKETPQHYFRNSAEMVKLFDDVPEAIANTVQIAMRCAYAPSKSEPTLPPFPVAAGQTATDALKELAYEGLKKRLSSRLCAGIQNGQQNSSTSNDQSQPQILAQGRDDKKVYWDRLDFELDVINQMGFPGYFLIVADFIQWAKSQGIPVGPGRGSGAGSVAAWALMITDLDPLQFNLLFERFLNPERVSMPDFDIDFCQDRRDEVINYVREKYGAEYVAQIITFGKLQARAVLRDVGRVLQVPYPVVNRISGLVPNNPANPVTLAEAIEGEPLFRERMDEDPTVARMVDISLKLEGLYRHASTHAAGVVIGDRPLKTRIPIYRDPKSPMLVTGFSMKDVENSGLVKFDFLGLKTLTVLQEAVRLIAERGTHIDVLNLPWEDEPTFAMLSRGEASGVFQLESSGMRDTLRRLKPNRFEDIIALVSLYRPGPMDNIPKYCAVKDGTEEADYLHPLLEPILKETYGIMVYQEQVMQVAQVLAGYSLGGADLLRRAMGKKIKEEMAAQQAQFVKGAAANNVDAKTAAYIFEQVDKFAGYGFNKSHAAAYALIAWQTAYLKAHYPVEFIAALMTLDLGNTDKLSLFRQELKRLDIQLLPPSINHSLPLFGVENHVDGKLAVRYALGAIKGVGAEAMRAVVAERERNGKFKDLQDLASRTVKLGMSKRQWEALAAAGAFDDLCGGKRCAASEAAETFLRYAQNRAEEAAQGQISLFGDAIAIPAPPLPQVKEWPNLYKLQQEFSAIGFFLSAHPLDSYGRALRQLEAVASHEVGERVTQGKGARLPMAGIVTSVNIKTAKSGNKFAFVGLSDGTGTYEITLFSEVLSIARELLVEGNALLCTVDAAAHEDSYRLTCSQIRKLDAVVATLPDRLEFTALGLTDLQSLQERLGDVPPGKAELMILLNCGDGTQAQILLPQKFQLQALNEAIAA